MQVGESTLKELIEGEKQFQVPLYQRQYAWTSPQLSQLWEDVLEQYDVLTPDELGKVDHSAPTTLPRQPRSRSITVAAGNMGSSLPRRAIRCTAP